MGVIYYEDAPPPQRKGISIEDGPGFAPGSHQAPPPTTPGTPPPPPPPPPPAAGGTPPPSGATSTPVPLPPAAPAPVPVPQLPTPSLPAPPAPVGIPRYLADDYAAAARSLMPRGRVWPTDPSSVQQQFLLGVGKTFERSDASAMAILAGALPGSPVSGFLPEWEATLGLPDPCLGASPTFDQRAAQVRARFVRPGGLSRQHYIDFAAALGFTITISVYSTAHPGPSGFGISSGQWPFVIGVNVVLNTSGLPESALQCELEAIKPAETTIIFLS